MKMSPNDRIYTILYGHNFIQCVRWLGYIQESECATRYIGLSDIYSVHWKRQNICRRVLFPIKSIEFLNLRRCNIRYGQIPIGLDKTTGIDHPG